MKRYAEYKDSGIEWIGVIPKHWTIKKLKYLSTEPHTLFLDGDWIESNVIENEGIRYLTTGNIGIGKFKEQGEGFISAETFHKLNCSRVFPGDLIISRLNEPIGRACIIPDTYDDYIVAVDNVILRPNHNCSKEFLVYYMNTSGYAHSALLIARGTTMSRISRTQLGNLSIVLPSFEEQQIISGYLDTKATAIDTLVADKQKLVDLLKEKRQAIISEAVTKGLDKNAKMKDSGIEWIGNVPEHWTIKKLSYIAETLSGGTPSRDKHEYWDDGNIPWMSSGEINNEFITETKEYITTLGFDNSNAKWIPKNAVLMALNGQGKTKGATAILGMRTTCNQSLVGFVCNEKEIEYEYLFYSFKAMYKYIRSLVGDESREGLSVSFLRSQRVAVPPIDEQKNIIQAIKKKVKEIDALSFDIELQIDKLKEYRQSIISEAVTGKIMIESESESESESVEIKTPTVNLHFKRRVLAAHILNELYDEPTMGHVKLEKLLFLSEYCAESDLGSKYVRHAAGPYDSNSLRSIDAQLKKAKWFDCYKDGFGYKYRKLEKSNDYATYYDRYFDDQQKGSIASIINMFKTASTEQCEIVATLYGAWNDFLIDGITPDDNQIVTEVLSNWHESKAKIRYDRWMTALNWMRSNNIIPVGYGKSTKGGNP